MSKTLDQPRTETKGSDPAAAPFRLLVSCADQPGIVNAVSHSIYEAGGNIRRSAQYTTDPEGGRFFLRMEFALPEGRRDGFADRFRIGVAERFDMNWHLADSSVRKRVGILVSRYDHCLLDLLWRWRRRELDAEVVLVASNWDDLRLEVEGAGLPYHHVPVTKKTKAEAEQQLLDLLQGCDLTVLARYMQVLSADFLERIEMPLINIHHSFLPAFSGAAPYEQAKVRGVKLIGATAHYVTPELDAGPIIEQDTVRVSHDNTVPQLTQLGAEIERTVLGRAVKWHCEDRVIRHGNTTVVF
jgi:formyltetrahydrofolate deformylase